MAMNTFSAGTWEAEMDLGEFEANLISIGSSSSARDV